MEYRWIFEEQPEQIVIDELSKAINVNASLSAVLAQRGVHSFDKARDFFRPQLKHLHDPFSMKDMDKAVARIQKAISSKEKILVYGDYDVDGTTAVSLVYGFLKGFYDQLGYYIPDRYAEGYGISQKGIDWAKENGASLIISLDCGIKAVDLVNYAAKRGIDFIICDHHKPGNEIPKAVAVLDPKRKDCTYPFDELSGCGVGFKLLEAFCIAEKIDFTRLYPYLDLVVVSIAADIVPIIGENRVLAYHGLRQLNESPRPGLKALKEIASAKKEMSITNVVFGLAPRINAAGRIGHGTRAVELLLATNELEAEEFAAAVNQKNDTRKTVDGSITAEALAMISDNTELVNAKSTVLYKEDWHKGVIGIVASRCIEKFYRPTVILTKSNEKATGSVRSVSGFDVYEAISECSDLLEQYGGHKYAAGLTMEINKVTAFQKRFEQVVSEKITEDQQTPQIRIQQEVKLDSLNYKFYNILKQMAPFGPGNLCPTFIARDVFVAELPRLIKDEHIKALIQQGNSGLKFDSIGFGLASKFRDIDIGVLFDVVFTLEENDFRGKKTLQLNLKDIKLNN